MTVTEDITAQIDGVVVNFTTSTAYNAGTLIVYHNGQQLRPGFDYTEDGGPAFNTFTMCYVPETGDTLQTQLETDSGTAFPLVIASGIDPTNC
jgi:hypothetical protein